MPSHTHCHICDSSETRILDVRFEVHACRACGHEFSALPPERQETYSPEYFREVHKKWFAHPNVALFRRIHDAVEEQVGAKAGSSFLDVGCGQGDLLRYMKQAGSRVKLFGIDLVQNSDEGVTYYQGDFVSFPFTQKFDVVSGLMVIEHVGDPRGFIQKISSVLQPQGLVIMNTINAGGFLYSFARALRSAGMRGPFERLYDKHHLEHYKTHSLRKLFELEGYDILSHRTHNFPLKALDVPEGLQQGGLARVGNTLLAFIYRVGVSCAFFFTSRLGGVHQTIVCKKK